MGTYHAVKDAPQYLPRLGIHDGHLLVALAPISDKQDVVLGHREAVGLADVRHLPDVPTVALEHLDPLVGAVSHVQAFI